MPIRVTAPWGPFLDDLNENFWGKLCGQSRQAWKRSWDRQPLRKRDPFLQSGWHERMHPTERYDYRNELHERDYRTPPGTILLRAARPPMADPRTFFLPSVLLSSPDAPRLPLPRQVLMGQDLPGYVIQQAHPPLHAV